MELFYSGREDRDIDQKTIQIEKLIAINEALLTFFGPLSVTTTHIGPLPLSFIIKDEFSFLPACGGAS